MKKGDRLLELDRQLCFPLYAASRNVIRIYEPYLKRIGLTYTQYVVMLVMWEEEKVSMHELGRRLYLDSGTLTPLLVKLENRGLIEKRRNDKDEREIIIKATPKGIGLKAEARSIPGQVGKCLGISPLEAIQLRNILRKILPPVAA